MKLSENFTLEELICTSVKNVSNTPDDYALTNLKALCALYLQPLRDAIKKPVIINSGYRSAEVNNAVGGAKNSYHLYGLAVDIRLENIADAFVIGSFLNYQSDQMKKEYNTLAELILSVKCNSYWLHAAMNKLNEPYKHYCGIKIY